MSNYDHLPPDTRDAIRAAVGNTKLTYPDYEPSERDIEILAAVVEGRMTGDEAARIFIDQYKENHE